MAKVKHSAAGPYLGFGLQTVRLTVRLLSEEPTSWVFVEQDDDISVRYDDGSVLLEQTKSALKQNPVADWARDLWKSIANWMDFAPTLKLPDGMVAYRLYVAPHHTGNFVSKMHNAAAQADVSAFVNEVKATVDAARRKTEAYKFAARFLDADLKTQTALLTKFKLICEDDPLEPLRALYRPSVRPELLDEICAFAVGEAKQQTDELIRAGEPGGLAAGTFQARVRSYVQRINLPELFSFSAAPGDSSVAETLNVRPVFVRQLELIDASDEQRLLAVSDYLRASADKTDWATKGILLPEALEAWDDKLVRQRDAAHDKLSALHSVLHPSKLGSAIYAECRGLDVQLDSKAVPSHFTHGCLNDLADRLRLGWHPDYRKLLSEE